MENPEQNEEQQPEVSPEQIPQEPNILASEKKTFNWPVFIGVIVIVVAVVVGYFILSGDTTLEDFSQYNEDREKAFEQMNEETDLFEPISLSRISLEHDISSDWVITTGSGENEGFLLSTNEIGRDPTQVNVQVYNLSIEETLKEKSIEGSNPDIEEIIINEKTLIKRTGYFEHNECTQIQYFHEINKVTTGVVTVSGTCPTHRQGYDEEKVRVAESVKFIVQVEEDSTVGWKIYRNDEFRIEFKYPIYLYEKEWIFRGLSDEYWGPRNADLVVDFFHSKHNSETLRLNFFKKDNLEGSFQNYIDKHISSKYSQILDDITLKQFQANNLRIAKIGSFMKINGFENTEYFVELPNNKILYMYVSGGDEKCCWQPDGSFTILSIGDDIISTIRFLDDEETNNISERRSYESLSPEEKILSSKDTWSISYLNQMWVALEFFHRDHKRYPNDLEELRLEYLSFPPEETGAYDLSQFHYYGCDTVDDFHIGVSLYFSNDVAEKKNDDKARVLSKDLDKKVCEDDPIQFADSSECMSGDVGNYCFDLSSVDWQ